MVSLNFIIPYLMCDKMHDKCPFRIPNGNYFSVGLGLTWLLESCPYRYNLHKVASIKDSLTHVWAPTLFTTSCFNC